MTWAEAQQACLDSGSNLATISNHEEFSVVSNIAAGYEVWIGLNDVMDEGHFVWADGSTEGFMPWAPSEPNDYSGSEDCAHITLLNAGELNDNRCDQRFSFLCSRCIYGSCDAVDYVSSYPHTHFIYTCIFTCMFTYVYTDTFMVHMRILHS